MKHYYKKTYLEKLKDSLVKPFDQIYEEYSKWEKIGHWIIVVTVSLFIASVWLLGPWWR